jgi:hypothetical protein
MIVAQLEEAPLYYLAALQPEQHDRRARFSSAPKRPNLFWSSPDLVVNGYWGALALGVKRPMCEADKSPLSSVQVKNAYSYTSTQHMFCGVYRVNFTFYLLILVICSEDRVVGVVTNQGSAPVRGRRLFFL